MPRRDIFNRRTDVFGGTFAADEASISFPTHSGTGGSSVAYAGDVGLLIQDLQTVYTQNVTRLFEVGRPAIYYVGGRTSGTATIGRVIGPRTIATAFYHKFGDICQARTNTLEIGIRTGCGADEDGSSFAGVVTYTCHFCVITSIGVGVRAADMMINETLQMLFSSFDYQGQNDRGLDLSFAPVATDDSAVDDLFTPTPPEQVTTVPPSLISPTPPEGPAFL